MRKVVCLYRNVTAAFSADNCRQSSIKVDYVFDGKLSKSIKNRDLSSGWFPFSGYEHRSDKWRVSERFRSFCVTDKNCKRSNKSREWDWIIYVIGSSHCWRKKRLVCSASVALDCSDRHQLLNNWQLSCLKMCQRPAPPSSRTDSDPIDTIKSNGAFAVKWLPWICQQAKWGMTRLTRRINGRRTNWSNEKKGLPKRATLVLVTPLTVRKKPNIGMWQRVTIPCCHTMYNS